MRFPPPTGKHVVLLHQIARALGWSAARVRGADATLKPRRLADGSRVYAVERVQFFIWTMDGAAELAERAERYSFGVDADGRPGACDRWPLMTCRNCAARQRRSRLRPWRVYRGPTAD